MIEEAQRIKQIRIRSAVSQVSGPAPSIMVK